MSSTTFDSVKLDSAKAALGGIIESTIAPNAAEVDANGAFPRAALDALSAAGLLGLLSSRDVGGAGGSVADAAEVIEKIASACGSTAMVVLMHYPGTAVLEAHGTAGLGVAGRFDGLELRGHASTPITAEGAVVPGSARLGGDRAGLDIALGTAPPTFLVLSAAFSRRLMEAIVAEAAPHLGATRLEQLDQTLAEQPLPRAAYARPRIRTDQVRPFRADTLAALGAARPDATLRVPRVKAAASEAASEVADGVLRVCGGAALGRELGVERRLRDSLAARVKAPTTDALHDFVGRAALGLPLYGHA